MGNSPWELAFSNLPLGNPWIAAFFFAMAFAFIATFDLCHGSTFFSDGSFHHIIFPNTNMFFSRLLDFLCFL